MSTAEKALETAQNAAGSAEKEQSRYMESIQGHISVVKNEFQDLWANAIDPDFINKLLDIGAALLQLVDNAGLFKTALTAAMAAFSLNGAGGANFILSNKTVVPI